MSNPLRRIISVLTIASYLCTQSTCPLPKAEAAEPAKSEVSVSSVPFDLSIPSDLGAIESMTSGSGPTLIQIQTAHGNYEAQKKIQAILHYLKDRYGIKTLFIEGSATKLNPEMLKYFPHYMDKTMEANEELTKEAIVKGPELFLLEEPEAEAYGIEDPTAYRDNLTAFRAVLEQKEKSSKFVQDMDLQIERLTSPYLNKDLRSVLKRVELYELNQIPLEKWLEELKALAGKYLKLDLSDVSHQIEWPMMVRIFKLRELEKTMDASAFEEEKAAFRQVIGKLVSASCRFQVEQILNQLQTRTPRSEQNIRRTFEDLVRELPRDFNYNLWPQLRAFTAHAILQSELKGEELTAEVDMLMNQILDMLALKNEEKQILGLLKIHRLLKKLFALELTQKDYRALLEGGETSRRPSTLTTKLALMNELKRVKDAEFENIDQVDALFDKALEFYAGTQKRDDAMLSNIQKRLQETGKNRAVMITGGFHSGPFQDYFGKKKFNYALITPKISTTGGREAYLKTIMGGAPFAPSTLESWSRADLLRENRLLDGQTEPLLEIVRRQLRAIIKILFLKFQRQILADVNSSAMVHDLGITISEPVAVSGMAPQTQFTVTGSSGSQFSTLLSESGYSDSSITFTGTMAGETVTVSQIANVSVDEGAFTATVTPGLPAESTVPGDGDQVSGVAARQAADPNYLRHEIRTSDWKTWTETSPDGSVVEVTSQADLFAAVQAASSAGKVILLPPDFNPEIIPTPASPVRIEIVNRVIDASQYSDRHDASKALYDRQIRAWHFGKIAPKDLAENLNQFIWFYEDGSTRIAVYQKDSEQPVVYTSQELTPQILKDAKQVFVFFPDRAKRVNPPQGRKPPEITNEGRFRLMSPASVAAHPSQLRVVWTGPSGEKWQEFLNPIAIVPPDRGKELNEQVSSRLMARADADVSVDQWSDEANLWDLLKACAEENGLDLSGEALRPLAAAVKRGIENIQARGRAFDLLIAPVTEPSGRTGTRLGVNGPGAGASQWDIHIQLLGGIVYPVETAGSEGAGRVESTEIEIGTVADFPGVVVLNFGGLRVFLTERQLGIPPEEARFNNVWGFSEVSGISIVDGPEVFFEMSEDQRQQYEAFGQDQAAKIQWIKEQVRQRTLTFRQELGRLGSAALQAVNGTSSDAATLAQELIRNEMRATQFLIQKWNNLIQKWQQLIKRIKNWLMRQDWYHHWRKDYHLVCETVYQYHAPRAGRHISPKPERVTWSLRPASEKLPKPPGDGHMREGQQFSVWAVQEWVPHEEAAWRMKLTAEISNLEAIAGISAIKSLLVRLRELIIRGDVANAVTTSQIIGDETQIPRPVSLFLTNLQEWTGAHSSERTEMREAAQTQSDLFRREIRESEEINPLRMNTDGTVQIGEEAVKTDMKSLQDFFGRMGWEILLQQIDPSTLQMWRNQDSLVDLTHSGSIESALRNVLPPTADVIVQPEYPGSARLWAQIAIATNMDYREYERLCKESPLARWMVPFSLGSWNREVILAVPVVLNPLYGFTDEFLEFSSLIRTLDGAPGRVEAVSRERLWDQSTIYSINRVNNAVRFSPDKPEEIIGALRQMLPRSGRSADRRKMIRIIRINDMIWLLGERAVPAHMPKAAKLEEMKQKAMILIRFGYLEHAQEVLGSMEAELVKDLTPGNHYLLSQVRTTITGLKDITRGQAVAVLRPETGFVRPRLFSSYELSTLVDLDELMEALQKEKGRYPEHRQWPATIDLAIEAVRNGDWDGAIRALEKIKHLCPGREYPANMTDVIRFAASRLAWLKRGKVAAVLRDMSQLKEKLSGWEPLAAPQYQAGMWVSGRELWEDARPIGDKQVLIGAQAVLLERQALNDFFTDLGWPVTVEQNGDTMKMTRRAFFPAVLSRPDSVEEALRDVIPVADIRVERESPNSPRLRAQITIHILNQEFRERKIAERFAPWIVAINTSDMQLTRVTLNVPVSHYPKRGYTEEFRQFAARIHELDGGKHPIEFEPSYNRFMNDPWPLSRRLGDREFAVTQKHEVLLALREILPRGGRRMSREAVTRVLDIPDMIHYFRERRLLEGVSQREAGELEKLKQNIITCIELGLVYAAIQQLVTLRDRLRSKTHDHVLYRQVVRIIEDLRLLERGEVVAAMHSWNPVMPGVWWPQPFKSTPKLVSLDDMIWYLGEIDVQHYKPEDRPAIDRARNAAQQAIRRGQYDQAVEHLTLLSASLKGIRDSRPADLEKVTGAFDALMKLKDGRGVAILRNRSQLVDAAGNPAPNLLSRWEHPVNLPSVRNEVRQTVSRHANEGILIGKDIRILVREIDTTRAGYEYAVISVPKISGVEIPEDIEILKGQDEREDGVISNFLTLKLKPGQVLPVAEGISIQIEEISQPAADAEAAVLIHVDSRAAISVRKLEHTQIGWEVEQKRSQGEWASQSLGDQSGVGARLELRPPIQWEKPERILNYGGSFTDVLDLLRAMTDVRAIDTGAYQGKLNKDKGELERTVEVRYIKEVLSGVTTEYAIITISGHPQITVAGNFFGPDKDSILKIIKDQLGERLFLTLREMSTSDESAAKDLDAQVSGSPNPIARRLPTVITQAKLAAAEQLYVVPQIEKTHPVWIAVNSFQPGPVDVMTDSNGSVVVTLPKSFQTPQGKRAARQPSDGSLYTIQVDSGTEFARDDGAVIRIGAIRDSHVEVSFRPPFARRFEVRNAQYRYQLDADTFYQLGAGARARTGAEILDQLAQRPKVEVKNRTPKREYGYRFMHLWAATPAAENMEEVLPEIAGIVRRLSLDEKNRDNWAAQLMARPGSKALDGPHFDARLKLLRVLFPWIKDESTFKRFFDATQVYPFAWDTLDDERVLFSLGHIETRIQLIFEDMMMKEMGDWKLTEAQVLKLSEEAHQLLAMILKTGQFDWLKYVNNYAVVYFEDRIIQMLAGEERYEYYREHVMEPEMRLKNEAALVELASYLRDRVGADIQEGMPRDIVLAILAGWASPQDRSGIYFRPTPQYTAVRDNDSINLRDYMSVNHLRDLFADIEKDPHPELLVMLDDVTEVVFNLYTVQTLMILYPKLKVTLWVNKFAVENNIWTAELGRILRWTEKRVGAAEEPRPIYGKLQQFMGEGRLSVVERNTPLLAPDVRFIEPKMMRWFEKFTAVYMIGVALFETTLLRNANKYCSFVVVHPATMFLTGFKKGMAAFLHVPRFQVPYEWIPSLKRFKTTTEFLKEWRIDLWLSYAVSSLKWLGIVVAGALTGALIARLLPSLYSELHRFLSAPFQSKWMIGFLFTWIWSWIALYANAFLAIQNRVPAGKMAFESGDLPDARPVFFDFSQSDHEVHVIDALHPETRTQEARVEHRTQSAGEPLLFEREPRYVSQVAVYEHLLETTGTDTPDYRTVMANVAVRDGVGAARIWSERILPPRLGLLFQHMLRPSEVPRAILGPAIERVLGTPLAFADEEVPLPVIPKHARIRLSEGVTAAENGAAAFSGLWPQVYLAHLPAFYNVIRKLKERHAKDPSALPALAFEINQDLFVSDLKELLRHPRDKSLTQSQRQELLELVSGREHPDQLQLEDLIRFGTAKSFGIFAAENGAAVIHSQAGSAAIEGDGTINIMIDPAKLEHQLGDEPLLLALLSDLPFNSIAASILVRGEKLSVAAVRLTEEVLRGLSIVQNGNMLEVTGGWAAYLRNELTASRILVQSA